MISPQFNAISSTTRQAAIRRNMEASENFFVQLASGTFVVKLEPDETTSRRRRGSKSVTPKPAPTPRVSRRRKHEQAFSGSPQSSAAPSPVSFSPSQPITPQQFNYPAGVPYFPQQQAAYYVQQQAPNGAYYQIQDLNTNQMGPRQPLQNIKNEAVENQQHVNLPHPQQFYYMPVMYAPNFHQNVGNAPVPTYVMPGMIPGQQSGQFVVNGPQLYYPQAMPHYVPQMQNAPAFQQPQIQMPPATSPDLKNQQSVSVTPSPELVKHESALELPKTPETEIVVGDARSNELDLPAEVDFYKAFLF